MKVSRLVLHLFLLLAVAASLAKAQNETQSQYHAPPKKHHPPMLPPCTFKADFSNTEDALRSAILKGDLELATKVLTANDTSETFSLGRGFTYTPDLQCFLRQSENRARDPDIVAIQALAHSAERNADTERLARATVNSFTRECGCPLFTGQELDDMARNFQQLFDDPKERQAILAFNGNEHDHSGRRLSRRRLTVTESSPTDSFVCAHCDPRAQCRSSAHWCEEVDDD